MESCNPLELWRFWTLWRQISGSGEHQINCLLERTLISLIRLSYQTLSPKYSPQPLLRNLWRSCSYDSLWCKKTGAFTVVQHILKRIYCQCVHVSQQKRVSMAMWKLTHTSIRSWLNPPTIETAADRDWFANGAWWWWSPQWHTRVAIAELASEQSSGHAMALIMKITSSLANWLFPGWELSGLCKFVNTKTSLKHRLVASRCQRVCWSPSVVSRLRQTAWAVQHKGSWKSPSLPPPKSGHGVLLKAPTSVVDTTFVLWEIRGTVALRTSIYLVHFWYNVSPD